MSTDIWEKITEEDEIESFLQEANPYLAPIFFDKKTVSVRKTALSFYPNYQFYQLSNFDTIPTIQKYILYKPGQILPLTWSNEPIYTANAQEPIHLNKETILDYVRFFFDYVRGRHGRFIVVENVDDLLWREPPPTATRKTLSDMILPLHVIKKTNDNGYILVATMVFKDSLFHTTITVLPNGKVSLSNEEVIVEGMPVLVDVA